jgi:Flp pilus assembly protein CpaB
MWKVKRMNTARIVVLLLAVGAGGVAAYLAGGSDSKSLPAEPAAQLQTADVLVAKADIGLGQTVTPEDMHHPVPAAARQSGTLSLAQRSIADPNAVDIRPDDQGARRGNINAVRYGVSNPATIQKRPEGLDA